MGSVFWVSYFHDTQGFPQHRLRIYRVVIEFQAVGTQTHTKRKQASAVMGPGAARAAIFVAAKHPVH